MVNVAFHTIKLVKEGAGRYNVSNKINAPYDGFKYIREIFEPDTACEEFLWLLALDTKNKVVGAFTVSKGSLNSSIVHPREIFKRALVCNAASILIAHNHPSGEPTPSPEDINVTTRIKEAGKLIGIDLLDHIIIAGASYVSMKERGHV